GQRARLLLHARGYIEPSPRAWIEWFEMTSSSCENRQKIATLDVNGAVDLVAVRERTRLIAEHLGLSPAGCAKVAAAATEVARSAIGQGQVTMHVSCIDERLDVDFEVPRRRADAPVSSTDPLMLGRLVDELDLGREAGP